MTSAYEKAIGDRHVDPSWNQGRGAFGGLVAAMLLRAMEGEVADPARAPRSLHVHFAAPATGPCAVRASVVRAGNRVTHARAELRPLEAGGAIASFASASFCRSREGAVRYRRATPPAVPGAETAQPFPPGLPGVPAFLDHFDLRFVGDSKPFGARATPFVAAWARLREPPAVFDAALAALYLDILPPAVSATFDAPRPLASVDFTVQLFERFPRPDVAPDGHLLVAISSTWADDGYTEEIRDLWTPSGVLLGSCRQLIALL